MCAPSSLDRLQFDHDGSLDQQIGCVFPDNNAIVLDIDPMLLCDAQPGFARS